MNIKKLLGLILFTNAFIFAEEISQNSTEKDFSYSVNQSQEFDTSHWIKCPMSLSYKDGENLNTEEMEISFPTLPTSFKGRFFNCEDEDGMVYYFGYSEFPSYNFNLRIAVEILIDGIKKSPSKKLLAVSHPDSTDSFTIEWVENDKMSRLTFIKSKHLNYFLETRVINEIYRDVDSIGMKENERILNDPKN